VNLLHGEAVYLTAPTLEDFETLMPFLESMDYLRWSNLSTAYPRFTPQTLLDSMREDRKNRTGYQFVIRLQADDQPIGTCGLTQIDWHSRNARAGLGIADQGHAVDTLKVLLRYGFDEVNLHRVGAEVAGYNTEAVKAYEAVGFVVEATLREAIYRDLEYYDMLLMGVLASEWRAS
jgi:RimJ/RimL family protein N-acetyltransferase